MINYILEAPTNARGCSQHAHGCSLIAKMKNMDHKLSNAPTPKYFGQKFIENEYFEISAIFAFSQNLQKS